MVWLSEPNSLGISTIMQPTQDLVKRKNKFCCNATLDKLFSDLKSLLIYKVQEGIKTFGINKCTCLQTNWSKDGVFTITAKLLIPTN